MSEEEKPRRYSDEMLFRLDERMKVHIEWTQSVTHSQEARIKDMENWRKEVEQPIHYAGMLLLGLVLAFAGAIGTWLWKLLTRLHSV